MDAALSGLELTALLGRGTRFDGKLYFTGRLRIDGNFSGEIRSEDVLVSTALLAALALIPARPPEIYVGSRAGD